MLSKLAILAGVLAAAPKVGDTAPDFVAVDTDGGSHTLSEMVKSGPVILAFFPKAFTSGCQRELSAYRDQYPDIEKKGAQVLAISTDKPEVSKKFKESLKAPFTFIPDPDGKLVRLFDVKLPVISMAQRTTFVVGPDRKILDVKVGQDALNPAASVASCAVGTH